jgi:hypothetical protein
MTLALKASIGIAAITVVAISAPALADSFVFNTGNPDGPHSDHHATL